MHVALLARKRARSCAPSATKPRPHAERTSWQCSWGERRSGGPSSSSRVAAQCRPTRRKARVPPRLRRRSFPVTPQSPDRPSLRYSDGTSTSRTRPVIVGGAGMKIGIIGAGNIGSALVRQFTRAGHEVSVANSRGPETLEALADETRAIPKLVEHVAAGQDLVIVTIPLRAVTDLPDGIFDELDEAAPIVDTGNYYPQRDGKIVTVETELTESEWVARQIGRPVLKAFNNIYAAHLQDGGLPAGDPKRIALPVAGDDVAQKQLLFDLLDQIGFDSVDAGPLAESWRQQPATPAYGSDLDVAGLTRALADASSERVPEFIG
ncbi:MAG: NAD(P)-binding domain-containing protein [Thermoleophilia bacterium]|nr:NAD(P)-binding domain-containing protein [Thermoleophilia bacterium]